MSGNRPRSANRTVSAGKIEAATDAEIQAEIVRQLAARAVTSSICPSEVARALHTDEAAWRALMPAVRNAATRLADAGRVRITQGGTDVTRAPPYRGAIRIARGPQFSG